MKTRALLALLIGLIPLAPLVANDWPQWRGPDRTDVSKETGLLQTWPEKGPPLLWTVSSIGLGYSAPAVVGDRLYIMGTRGTNEAVFALDTKSGKEVWVTEIGPIFTKGHAWGDGPRSTPTVDGERIYAIGAQGELVCLETGSGKKVWSHNLFKEFNGALMDNNAPERIFGWGYCEGPLVDGNQVVVTPGGEDGLLLALDKKSGQVVWRSKEVKGKAPYSSIIVAEVGGVRQYIQLFDKGAVGVAAKDGKLLWHYAKTNDDLVIRTPIFHNNYVFIPYSFGTGSDLFQIIPAAGAFKTEKVYSTKNMKNETGGVVLVGEHLYGYSDRAGWVCMEFAKKKGATLWEEKRKLGKGSLTCADGRLYCYTEDDGTVALVEAQAKKFQQDGRFKIPRESTHHAPSGRIWTHPVVANGHLYLRDQELLFCYDVKGH